MAAVLAGNQHELMLEHINAGLVFGTQSTKYVTLTHPTVESDNAGGGNDLPRLREDGVGFNEEYVGSKTVGFEVGVLTDRDTETPHVDNGDALDLFESSWTSPDWRNAEGAFGVLRSHMIPGRVRRCYGRPRRFAATEDGLAKKGYSTFVCDFTNMDGLWYDDAETIASTPRGVNGGAANVNVGGTRATWPTITIYGPCSNPKVVLGGLTIEIPGVIAGGQWVTIDTRPWNRGIYRSHGGPELFPTFASTPLRRMRMQFGGLYPLTYTALGVSTDSFARVSFRNAWSRW